MNIKVHSTTKWVLPLTLLSVLVTALTGYRATLGEPDLVRMVFGMVYGNATGAHLAAGFHYGSGFSFAFYQLLYALIPARDLANPDQVALYLNYTGLAFSALFAGGLCLMLGRLLDAGLALFVAIVFLFSPLTLPLLASAHPFIGAAAMLFWATWLLLLAADKQGGARWMGFVLAALLLLISLCLRGDVVLGFPFVLLAYWFHSRRQGAVQWRECATVAVLLAVAFAGFLLLQRPYVEAGGGAVGSLQVFMSQYFSLARIARGMIVLLLSLGLVSTLLLAAVVWRRRLLRWDMVLVLAALALPGLLFWLPNPQPARHFALPVLGLIVLVGILYADKLHELRRAAVLALALVVANQLIAEGARPVIVAKYQWAYAADGRRATQQVPLGVFALDQAANRKTEEVLRAEGIALAKSAPQDLIVLADSQSYLIAWMLSADASLRLSTSKLGDFEVLQLSNAQRRMYFVDKHTNWPKDVLAELLPALPQDLNQTPIYIQPTTISRYDRTDVPAARIYNPTKSVVAAN